MQMAENLLWAATPIYRRGSHATARFYPYNWDDRGNGVPATLRIEDGGEIRYRSGGSSDPYIIYPEQLADCLKGLCHPSEL